MTGDKRAEAGVDEDVEVDDPDADRHRQEKDQDLTDALVAPVEAQREPELDPSQSRTDHQQLHDRRHEPRDRVCVDLVVAMEVTVQSDQQHQDHEVPGRGRERRDRELVVGLEDPDEQTGEAEEQDDGEEHAREPGRQARRDAAAGEQRHDQPSRCRPQNRQGTERDEDHPKERRGDAERLALATALQQFRKHRHERRRERRLREEVAEQVRDLRGQRERRRRRRGREVRRLSHFSSEASDSRQRGGDREDRGV